MLVTTAVGDDSYFYDVFNNEELTYRFIARYPIFSDFDGEYKGLYIDPSIEQFVESIDDETLLGTTVSKRENADSVICFVDLVFPNQEIQLNVCNKIETLIYPIVKNR